MKLDKILDGKLATPYKSPLIREIQARGIPKKGGCMCVEKDYVFADNEG